MREVLTSCGRNHCISNCNSQESVNYFKIKIILVHFLSDRFQVFFFVFLQQL